MSEPPTLLAPDAVPNAAATCAHCGAPLSHGGERFCCPGCAAAYEAVNRLGLDQYYAHRPAAAAAHCCDEAAPATTAPESASYVRREPDGSSSLAAIVDGLHCPACLWLIESALSGQQGVVSARLSLSTGRLRVRWQGQAERGAELLGLVRELGYRVRAYDPAELTPVSDDEERALLRALAVAGFAAGNIMLLSISVWAGNAGEMGSATRNLLHWISAAIAMPAVAYAGRPFFASAWAALRARRANMDVPISVAVLLATGMSLVTTIHSGVHAYFDSAVTLLFFLLIGRYLEKQARGRARSAAETLVALGAAPVTRLAADGTSERVMPEALAAGDMILVAPGERIGADGDIVNGQSEVERSLLDGETLPSPVGPGSPVHAGMTNLAAPLHIRVTATSETTYLAQIVRLMEAAESGRGRYVALADQVARFYAPAVHLVALATLALWIVLGRGWEDALTAAIAVLIITCPCSLGLAIPAVQVIAAGALMRRGILLKSGTALERLAAVDTVVFDKTGSVTLGRPALVGDPDGDALAAASALAAVSRHPLSRAIRALRPDVPAAEGVIEHPGDGLAWCGENGETRLGNRGFCGVFTQTSDGDGPELWLSRPGYPPTRFVFEDRLRPQAAETIAALFAEGYRVLLLSGDRRSAVERCAGALAVTDWAAELSPIDKTTRISALASDGRRVLMVGDGLNDAPALAGADVSMSPSSASDVSQNAADIVFQGDSLAAVHQAMALSRRSQSLVHQNLAFAALYNAIAVPLAVAGLATPLIAAVAMSSSSLTVTLNALRLRIAGAGRRR